MLHADLNCTFTATILRAAKHDWFETEVCEWKFILTLQKNITWKETVGVSKK